jgi:hypothetical protein
LIKMFVTYPSILTPFLPFLSRRNSIKSQEYVLLINSPDYLSPGMKYYNMF